MHCVSLSHSSNQWQVGSGVSPVAAHTAVPSLGAGGAGGGPPASSLSPPPLSHYDPPRRDVGSLSCHPTPAQPPHTTTTAKSREI